MEDFFLIFRKFAKLATRHSRAAFYITNKLKKQTNLIGFDLNFVSISTFRKNVAKFF